MTTTHNPARSRVWDDPRIVAPDEAAWEALSPSQRTAAIDRIVAVFDEYRDAMSEGTPHFRAKSGAAADLDGHFRRAKRQVFLACELGIFYPGEPMIVPDVSVVTDTDPDLDLDSWVVAERKRGIDLALEVRNTGAKHKDLAECVRDYARLRIPEYFAFDCKTLVLRGWRLPAPGARTYKPILPQGGVFASHVLGLELAVVERRIRFFAGGALVPTGEELLTRIQAMADESHRAAMEASEELSRVQAVADQHRREALEASEQRSQMRAGLARTILRALERRGLALDEAQRSRVLDESDPTVLTRWLDRAHDVPDAPSLFRDD